MKWYNKNNKNEYYVSIVKDTFNKYRHIPSGSLKIEVKNYFFGRPILGTGLIILDFLNHKVSKIYMSILDLFFSKKIKKAFIDKSGYEAVKTIYKSKLKYKIYKNAINKFNINTNKKIQKKLNNCDNRITHLSTRQTYINFCNTISIDDLDKTKIYIAIKQNHSYREILTNHISKNMIKNLCDFLFRSSHCAIIFFDNVKNAWFLLEKKGDEYKTYLKEKNKNGWNIGNLNNDSFVGNIFCLPLNIHIVGDTGIRRYFEATISNIQNTGMPQVSSWQILQHNLSKMMRTVNYPITNDMPKWKQKLRKFVNTKFTPKLADLIAKRDVPFSGACLELIIEILYNIIKDKDNKQFIKNFNEGAKFINGFLKYIIEYDENGNPIFCKTYFLDFILFLTHFANNGNGNFAESWKVIV